MKMLSMWHEGVASLEQQSFLIQYFNTFFEEVVRQKQRAIVAAQRPDTSAPQMGVDANHRLVESMAQVLEELISKQHTQVLHNGGEYALSLYREVQYVMVALADEIFLSFKWAGRSLWEEKILEERVFNSHISGERVFERIEELLLNHNADKDDLAKVYLFALGLGLKGKYSEDSQAIASYKRRLFLFTAHHHQRIAEPEYLLFTPAYGQLLENDAVRFLPNARIWHTVLYVCLMSLMFLSYVFWYSATHELESVAHQIISISGVDKT
jgi:type VI secretion system protein ImpK